jgi:glycosyltransferase involved in cell wall biosynthesis
VSAEGGDRPLVSVALATYNGGRYLGEQLDTIYAQTWPNLEVVASDDASTDGTLDVLADYARRRGLRYAVNLSRVGLVRNFERAIAMCRGEMIALSDQDDLWKPEKIATLVGAIGAHTLVYGNVQDLLGRDGKRRIETAMEPIYRFAREHGSGRPTRYLLAESWVVSHSLMFRRELVAHALPISAHQPFHDAWLALVAAKLGGIRYLDERLQIYREHEESMTFKPPAPGGRARLLRGLLAGSFQAAWRRRCQAETARLEDVLGHPLFDADDRAFAGELLAYYRSGLTRGGAWRSFLSGLRVAPFFSTQQGLRHRWKVPLRALIGGLAAASPAADARRQVQPRGAAR